MGTFIAFFFYVATLSFTGNTYNATNCDCQIEQNNNVTSDDWNGNVTSDDWNGNVTSDDWNGNVTSDDWNGN
jgi:hypothetical protein